MRVEIAANARCAHSRFGSGFQHRINILAHSFTFLLASHTSHQSVIVVLLFRPFDITGALPYSITVAIDNTMFDPDMFQHVKEVL